MSPWVLTLATVHRVTPFTRGNEENDKHALPQSSLLSLKPREDLHLLTAVSQMDASCAVSARRQSSVPLSHTVVPHHRAWPVPGLEVFVECCSVYV